MPDVDHHKATGGRRSWVGYMRILRSIHDGARSTKAIAEANGMRTESMREVLRRMLALDLVHIAGTEVAPNHLPTPLWDLGPGKTGTLPNNQPLQPNAELIALSYMLRAMGRCPQTVRSLSRESGVHRNRAEDFLRACRDELRMVFVAGYSKSLRLNGGGTPARLWSLGFDREDAARPAPEPREVAWARRNRLVAARKRQRRQLLALAANASIFTRAA